MEVQNNQQQLSDSLATSTQSNQQLKDVIQKYATILGCLVEFNSIHMSLSQKDS